MAGRPATGAATRPAAPEARSPMNAPARKGRRPLSPYRPCRHYRRRRRTRRVPAVVRTEPFHADRLGTGHRRPPLFPGTAGLGDTKGTPGGHGRPTRKRDGRTATGRCGRDTRVLRDAPSAGRAVPGTPASAPGAASGLRPRGTAHGYRGPGGGPGGRTGAPRTSEARARFRYDKRPCPAPRAHPPRCPPHPLITRYETFRPDVLSPGGKAPIGGARRFALAPNTRRAAAWASFSAWRAETGRSPSPRPPKPSPTSCGRGGGRTRGWRRARAEAAGAALECLDPEEEGDAS